MSRIYPSLLMIEDYGLYYIYSARAILLGRNALVIGFPGGEGDPGLMWVNMGTLSKIGVLVVGEMRGLTFTTTRHSGKMWGLCF